MKYNKYLALITAGIILLFSVTQTKGQKVYDTTTIKILHEVANLQAILYTTPYLSFDANYYMTDIDTVTVKDTIFSKYKLNGDSANILMLQDTIEHIQNENVSGTVYHTNRTIVVQKPSRTPKLIFQVDVTDNLFQTMSMKGMTATDSSCDRRIIISFDSGSIYRNFKLVYCKLTNRLSYITYSMNKELNSNSAKMINMYVNFTNYATGTFNSSVFSTNPYFKVNSASDIQLAPGMNTSYEIVNLLED